MDICNVVFVYNENSRLIHSTGIVMKQEKVKVVFGLLFMLCGAAFLIAQDNTDGGGDSVAVKAAVEPTLKLPDREEIEAGKKRALESQELDESAGKALAELYDKILVQLATIEKHDKEIVNYKNLGEQAPQMLEEIKKQLAQSQIELKAETDESLSLVQVEQKRSQIEAGCKALISQAAEQESEPRRRTDRRAQLPKSTAAAKERLEQLRASPPQTAPDESLLIFQVREQLYRVTEKAILNEIQSYNEEIASYDARTELLTARRELISRKVSESEKLLTVWRDIVTRRSRMEAEKVAQEAQQAQIESTFSHLLIKQLTEENVQLTNLLTGPDGLTARSEALSNSLEMIEGELAKREDEFKSVKERVETIGRSSAIGLYLLARKNDLPDINQNKRNLKERIELISATQYELLKHEEARTKLVDLNDELEELVMQLEPELSKRQRESIRSEAEKYLHIKRDNLKSIIDIYNTYFNKLIDLDVNETKLVTLVEQYDRFISEQIFWVRSSFAFSPESLKEAPSSLGWLVDSQNWLEVIKWLIEDFTNVFYLYILAALFLLFLLINRRKYRKRLFETSELLHQKYTDKYSYTHKALFLTLLLSIIRPGPFLFLGWRLSNAVGPDAFTPFIGSGCCYFSLLFLGLEIFMRFIDPAGLAQAHFGMPQEAINVLRRHTRWLMLLVLPCYFILTSIMAQPNERWQDSTGRLAFILLMTTLATYLFIVLRPSGAFIQKTLKIETSWIYRLRYLLYLAAGCLPLLLIILTILGYFYTARELARSFTDTAVFLFIIMVVKAMFERWLVLSQIKAAIVQSKQRLADAPREDSSPSAADGAGAIDSEIFELNEQVKHVLRTILGMAVFIGFWMIWSEVIPAIKGLQRVELWTVTIGDVEQIISLANVIIAGIILFLTVVFGRNFPGLLDAAVLEQLSVDHGVRFAIKTTISYIIFVVGTILFFNEIGIGWSKVQWLVGAMLVGLGFGLQEIFANFISGLLILFEQPIRVGDIVTVDDTTGIVTRIRIRATTIRNWDRKEYIVPNKAFITGRLLNWTLSDKINRIVINIGVAYGSDIELALTELNRVVRGHPLILEDPEPLITFEGFGASSLDLVVRCYLPNLDNRMQVITELHKNIDNAFRAAGIEISFPQSDIHIRSIESKLPLDAHPGESPEK